MLVDPPQCAWSARAVCKASLVLLVSLLAACSSKQVYNFGTEMGKNLAECDTKISASDRAECEAAYQKSFEDYQRARKAVMLDK